MGERGSRGLLRCTLLLFAGLLVVRLVFGQTVAPRIFNPADSIYAPSAGQVLVPLVLAGYGFSQFMVPQVRDLDLRVRDFILDRPHPRTNLDDYSQYAPAVAVYALNLAGIKGRHGFADRSLLLAGSLAAVGWSVQGVKRLTGILRPDGSTYNAFPSGHTATAFACAEFLRREYGDRSPWIGVAGYAVAAGTGFLRMYNNRHWLTDVVAGAGFGILSTRIAYWIFPPVRKFIERDMGFRIVFIPFVPLPDGII